MRLSLVYAAAILALMVPAQGANFRASLMKKMIDVLFDEDVPGVHQKTQDRAVATRSEMLTTSVVTGNQLVVRFDTSVCTGCTVVIRVYDVASNQQVAESSLPVSGAVQQVDGVDNGAEYVVQACREGDSDSCEIYVCPSETSPMPGSTTGVSTCVLQENYCDTSSPICDQLTARNDRQVSLDLLIRALFKNNE